VFSLKWDLNFEVLHILYASNIYNVIRMNGPIFLSKMMCYVS
jgi:hypothetical protein